MEIRPSLERNSLFDQRCEIKKGNRRIANVRYHTGLSAVIMKFLGQAIDLHDEETQETFCVNLGSFETNSKTAGLTTDEISILVGQVRENETETHPKLTQLQDLNISAELMRKAFGAPSSKLAVLISRELNEIFGSFLDPENPEDAAKLNNKSAWEFLKDKYAAKTDKALIEILMSRSAQRIAENQENRRALYGAPDDLTVAFIESHLRHHFGMLFDPANPVDMGKLGDKTPWEFVKAQYPGKDDEHILAILEKHQRDRVKLAIDIKR